MEARNCCYVIRQMINKIPPDKKELIKDLEWNYEDAAYKAPEETLQWERTGGTLFKHIPQPSEDWEWEVASIFTSIPVEKLKKTTVTDEDANQAEKKD